MVKSAISIMLLVGMLVFGIVGMGLVSASEDPVSVEAGAVTGEQLAEEKGECTGDCDCAMLQKQIRLQKQDCTGDCVGTGEGDMIRKQERKQINKQDGTGNCAASND